MSNNFEKAEIYIYKLSLSDIIACSPDLGPMDGPIIEDDGDLEW